MSLSNEIKVLRQRAYMTQTEFAEALGVSFTTVNRWETGKVRPNVSAMKKIKKFCSENSLDISSLENEWVSYSTEKKEDDFFLPLHI